MISQQLHSLLLMTLSGCVLYARAAIGENGSCSLFTFVPFTFAGNVSTPSMSGKATNLTNQGFSHMAAALLAMDHFNNRNTSVVPELANFTDCNVRFDMNQSLFFDTGSVSHFASKSFWQQEMEPCAMAGPFNDIPAIDLSVVALSAEIPLVAHRSFNLRVSSNNLSPFTSQVFPGTLASAKNLVDYLLYKGRTNYIGVLYSLTETVIQRREALALELNKNRIEWTSAGYDILNNVKEVDDSFFEAMSHIRDSGYRTIVVAMEFPWAEMEPLADTAEQLGMNQGDHFWIFYGIFDAAKIYSKNRNVTKLLSGSALLIPLSIAYLDKTHNFTQAWKTQGNEAVNRLNAVNPIQPGEVGYVFAENDWFQTVSVEYGSGKSEHVGSTCSNSLSLMVLDLDFLFDAVMSIGIGACLAEQTSNGTVSSVDHRDSIRRAVFTGATGRVMFGGGIADEPGVRDPSTVLWSEFNILPPQPPGNEKVNLSITGVYESDTEAWRQTEIAFVYNDGSTVSPALQDQPNQNYLSRGLRSLGLALMSITLMTAVVCAFWVLLRRKHTVLRASQPVFLYLISFGAIVETSAIYTISNDESYGWNEEQLSKSCMATPWLLILGIIFIYSALFTKLWRVNQVLQFARRKVELRHVAGPMVAIVLTAILVLGLWTGLDPLVWTRVETNDVTGESIGLCSQQHFEAFIIPLAFLMIIPAALTAIMAWKTIDVDEQFAESRWIFALILVQLEVVIIAVPVVMLLRQVSKDGRYVGDLIPC